ENGCTRNPDSEDGDWGVGSTSTSTRMQVSRFSTRLGLFLALGKLASLWLVVPQTSSLASSMLWLAIKKRER
ncbi:hypothetical protein ACTXT7_009100, partial [Hymenolepis weldensis]